MPRPPATPAARPRRRRCTSSSAGTSRPSSPRCVTSAGSPCRGTSRTSCDATCGAESSRTASFASRAPSAARKSSSPTRASAVERAPRAHARYFSRAEDDGCCRWETRRPGRVPRWSGPRERRHRAPARCPRPAKILPHHQRPVRAAGGRVPDRNRRIGGHGGGRGLRQGGLGAGRGRGYLVLAGERERFLRIGVGVIQVLAAGQH